jgi:superfamily II DNA/RNA helicase
MQSSVAFAHVRSRAADYYVSMVGALFDEMRAESADTAGWARLGNAFAQFATEGQDAALRAIGVSSNEAVLFAAAAFYCGGFPASAYLTIKKHGPAGDNEAYRACFDFLARPATMTSGTGRALVAALRRGDMNRLEAMAAAAEQEADAALSISPSAWIPARLLERLIKRFLSTNIRAVLPEGGTAFWTPLVSSLLSRRPPSWEFFPSQIEAIQRGLLGHPETFSLQMPTGAGKTTLCETLLYWHLKRNAGEVALLLVPYRSLASELRATLVRRLNAMGLPARCAYGGTVPLGDEVRGLDDVRAIVATPEAISGLLSADPAFFRRVSLVICDEGHLLDGGGRGVGLELLLARMKAREVGAPRFVFVSAIVPNIEEINAWLGGTTESVVRSDYRPALAEFSVLRTAGSGASLAVALEMHPHEAPPTRYSIAGFLRKEDFQWTNPATGRLNTFPFGSAKAQTIATARKALAMGAVAVFAANKRGNQGAVGLAEELLDQLGHALSLPTPITFVNVAKVGAAVEYLSLEYGAGWVGTRALAAGAVLHHGDIPQESREVVEALVRTGALRFAICTNTLAEGVNLPIRTLVLYSVQRRQKEGRAVDLLTRDIKNLVGRAGRAGATTKGLVICANSRQWPLVDRVARQAAVEPVKGALRSLMERLQDALTRQNITLTNPILEGEEVLHALIDGIDATLIDLAAEEIGEEDLVQLAIKLADQTFASQQADASSKKLLQDVFELRARRVVGVRAAGRLGWVRETGARVRLLDSVESALLPQRAAWDDVIDPIDSAIVTMLIGWAWPHADFQTSVRAAYQLEDQADTNSVRQSFVDLVAMWLSGENFAGMATRANLQIDDMLGIHAKLLTFVLQTLVEQSIALLAKLLESQGRVLADAVVQFPEHLRFGVPTPTARVLAAGALRHRRAAVALGGAREVRSIPADDRTRIFATALGLLQRDGDTWRALLGGLVFENTLQDLLSATGDGQGEER